MGQSGQGQSSKLVEHATAPGVLEGGEMRGEKGTVNLPGRGWGSGEEQPSGLVELVTTPEDLEGGMLRGVVEIISMPGPGVGACMNPSVGGGGGGSSGLTGQRNTAQRVDGRAVRGVAGAEDTSAHISFQLRDGGFG